MEKLQWWGYAHINGSIHLKRYLNGHGITEAEESPFVKELIGPFDATNKKAAHEKLKHELAVHTFLA